MAKGMEWFLLEGLILVIIFVMFMQIVYIVCTFSTQSVDK